MKRTVFLLLFTLFGLQAYMQTGKVYVVLFMHNEDVTFGNIADPVEKDDYLRHRTGLINMSKYLHDNEVTFVWQSDWKFLEAVLHYENAELMAETSGKNLVRWMKEDMGITVDAHSHEHLGYNYADVACLLDSLGIENTKIIGGHVWDPYNDSYANWERFRNPLRGSKFPHFVWNANVLIGSATPSHANDPHPSGIWRPKDKYHFWENDPDGEILCIGQYTGDIEGVEELVDLKKTGAVAESDILTCGIHTRQAFSSGFLDEFSRDLVEPLLAMQARGEVELVNFTELVEIWERRYASKPHLYNAMTDYIPDNFNVWIPSESAGDEGVFVRVTVPDNARYSDRKAPVVVHVPGGWNGTGISSNSHDIDDQGFIELELNFPGSGPEGNASGGVYDHRGENCIQALRDVTRFGLGLIPDDNGYYLRDMVTHIVPDTENVGLCGWSNGGNATITAAGAYGSDLPGLAWIVNWESPVGDGMTNVDAGRLDKENPAYDPDRGEFDVKLLAFSPDKVNDEGNKGVFYFDINNNGLLNLAVDYIAGYQYYNGKSYYSEWLREAAEDLDVDFPEHIANVEETGRFWIYRNGWRWIKQAVNSNPDLMFLVEAGEVDHVQGALDHPHILIQYMGFLNEGVRFARVNPDKYYFEQVVGSSLAGAADNDGMKTFDHMTIRSALQPRGIPLFTSEKSTVAGVCELADRTRFNNTNPQIDGSAGGLDEVLPDEPFAPVTCFPNPVTDLAHFSISLSRPGEVKVLIYDTHGRKVNQILAGELGQGQHILAWDLTDQSGNGLVNGLFYFKIVTSEFSATGRMLLLK